MNKVKDLVDWYLPQSKGSEWLLSCTAVLNNKVKE